MTPRGLKVDWCDYEAAKFAVMNWHYSKAMPASKLAKIGVWEDGKFIGAIIFGMGANNHIMCPYGLQMHEGCELVRVALTKHKAPVSKMVAIAIRMVRHRYKRLRLVISYADPGEGHRGAIYQAGNWFYLGKTNSDRFPILEGRVAHPRTLSERIARGTIKSRKAVNYVRKPGKHRYAYPLDDDIRKRLEQICKPYPSASEAGDGRTPAVQRRGGTDPDAPTCHGQTDQDHTAEDQAADNCPATRQHD